MFRVLMQMAHKKNLAGLAPCATAALPQSERGGTCGSLDHPTFPGPAAPTPRQRNLRLSWAWFSALLLCFAAAAQAQSNFGPQPVGATTAAQSVSVSIAAPGTVASVQVLTAGASSLDFALGSGGSNCVSQSYPASCQASVTFTPLVPGPRAGAVVLLDSSNNVLGTAYLSGIGQGALPVFIAGNTPPVAGNGNYLDQNPGDGKPALSGELFLPTSVALDGAGNMYIADSGHNRIRMVAAATGIISTIAGSGDPSYSGDGGAAGSAALNSPSGVAVDGAGNLYIADTGNNVIREITTTGCAIANCIVTTVAGNGTAGYAGDGLAATSAATELHQPKSIAIDSSGNLYIADTPNQRIREVNAVSGIITTVAGNGTAGYAGDGLTATSATTELNEPYAVAFDASGNMYICDSSNNVIREVANVGGTITAASIISTFAGNGTPGYSGNTGPATSAELSAPLGVVADPAGNVYISDTQNNAIRKVSSKSSSQAPGIISTIAVTTAGEYIYPVPVTIKNGVYSAKFYAQSIHGPIGLFLDGSGDLYFADFLNQQIREIQSNYVAVDLTRTPVRQGSTSAAQKVWIGNNGNLPLDLSAIAPDGNSTVDDTSLASPCTQGSSLAAADVCEIGAVFAPPAPPTLVVTPPSEDFVANIGVTGETAATSLQTGNSPMTIQLVAVATPVNATTTTLTPSLNPSTYGTKVTFTATVTAGTGNPTGSVNFFLDGVSAGTGNLAVSGGQDQATYSTAALTVGTHTVYACYNNATDLAYLSSCSTDFGAAALTQVVQEATTTQLASSANPSAVGGAVTFKATVTPSGGATIVPDLTVTFTDGSNNTTLCTSTLVPVGGASYAATATCGPMTTLTQGLHPITATFSGDAPNWINGSSSAVVKQEVQAQSTTALTSSGTPSIYGNSVTFTATVTGTSPTGTISFSDTFNGKTTQIGTGKLGSTTGVATFATPSLGVGSHSIAASYPGDANNASSISPAVAQVVNQTVTLTTVTALPTTGIAGTPVALTATVTVTQGVNSPQGTIQFTSNGTAIGSPVKVAGGTATLPWTFSPPGTYLIVATYSGDTDDGSSASQAFSLTVALATTQTAIAPAPSPSIVLAAVTYTATVTGNGAIPTGSVTFLSGTTAIGTAPLNAAGVATLNYAWQAVSTAGNSITAVYGGDTNDAASTSPAVLQVVNAIPTNTALAVPSTGGGSSTIVLLGTVYGATGPTPTGTVAFLAGTAVLGSVPLDASGAAAFTPNLANGTYNVVASYGGDALHAPSQSQPVSVSSAGSGYTITVIPASVTVATGQNTTVSLALTSLGSFTDTVGLGCGSLPAGVNCSFSSISVVLAANATQTVQLTIDTNNPLGGGTTASSNAPPTSRSPLLAGVLLPLGLFFGCFLARFRKRHRTVFAAVLFLALSCSAMLLNGCGGFSQSTAVPGSYVIQVIGTGANSNIVYYQNVKLTITK